MAGRYLYPKAAPTTQWEMFEREKARVIDALLADWGIVGGRVLEYGCGTAGMSVYLANHGFQATATDISIAALKLANLNFRANGPGHEGNFGVSTADVLHLPFPDGIFDVSMSHGLLEHFHPQLLPSVLQEATRILKPGGLFLADISHGRFSVRKVSKWLNFPLALGYYSLRADAGKLRALLANYFAGFYENRLGAREWKKVLEDAGLVNVELQVQRPFPPFALTPALDKKYVALMEKLMPFWNRFDASQSWVTRRWGWLYLAYGIKP